MNVLMICQDVRVDRRIVLEARTLIDAGYRVVILARASSEGSIPVDETDMGVPIRRIRVEGRDPRFRMLTRLSRVGGRPGYAGAVAAAKLWGAMSARNTFNMLALPLAVRAKADVYHAHDLINLPVAHKAAAQTGAKLAYDAHELFSEIDNRWIRMRRAYWRATEARLLPLCDVATTVNEFIADEIATRYQVSAPEVIYNCPPAPEGFDGRKAYRQLHTTLGIPRSTRIVLYQGWMAEGRGLEELIIGASHLRKADALLVLMGYGEHRAALELLSREHGLQDVVRFLDAVPQADLVLYCASATVGVIPYRPVDLNNYYSSPNKLFDFIQARTPILANDLPFLRKVVKERELGMVAQMTTPDSVGRAMVGILNLLDDKDARTRIAHNLKEAAQVYNWESEGAKLVRLFRERIGEPAGESS